VVQFDCELRPAVRESLDQQHLPRRPVGGHRLGPEPVELSDGDVAGRVRREAAHLHVADGIDLAVDGPARAPPSAPPNQAPAQCGDRGQPLLQERDEVAGVQRAAVGQRIDVEHRADLLGHRCRLDVQKEGVLCA
jgi:hypothetical protein